jgi:serine/threonine-protein kinase
LDHRDATNRDLLIGLLALQTGLVEQDVLILAFRAWTRDKSRSIAEILAAQGAIDGDERALLENLAVKHLRRHDDDSEKSLAALNPGRSLRAGLAKIGDSSIDDTLGHVGSSRALTRDDDEEGEFDRTASLSLGAATSDGQRFRILRPHARGGLGEVFVALDAELHREVAIKQILDKHADDPTSRERFVAEAEITGGLEHPGVVPVYGLGSYGDGRPYYAMRFIKGESLKQAIEHFHADDTQKSNPGRRSLELRKLLRRFLDVCNAIEYAHSRGVIHRDVKPANIILGRHGETLVVDWGLAKAVGRADPSVGEQTIAPLSSGSSETLPGSALGTPAYMSPEQAAGELDRLGPRSDVYSLGATLYCLLTGRPPFLGDDAGMILPQVQQGEFPSPRALDPSIDRALEAVCLKAMAVKPENRYASPRALADDVERWMADEPVAARREPWAERARRWGRRNRTVVMTAGAAVLVALLGTAAVLAVQTQANRRLNTANLDLREANAALAAANAQVSQANAGLTAANERVVARFDLALEAVKLFHGDVSEDLLLKESQFDALRTKLLRGAADFYRKLEGLLKPQADQASRAALGRAYEALGEVTDKIGSKPEALAIHREALAARRALAAEPGADATITGDVTQSLLAIGDLQRVTGDTSGALSSYRESLAICEALARANPNVTQFQRNLASSHHDIGLLLGVTGKPAGALEAHGKARAIQQKLADAHPDSIQLQRDLAQSYARIGIVLHGTGKQTEALEAYGKARAIQERLADAHPAMTQFQSDLATSHFVIGFLLRMTGKSGEALASWERARAIQQRLADAHPAVTEFQRDLAVSHRSIGGVWNDAGKPREGLASNQAALAIQQRLADAHPTVTLFQIDLADSHIIIGINLKETGELEEALASLKAALAIAQRLADADTTDRNVQVVLANSLLESGDVLRLTGRPAEARSSYEKALAIISRLVQARSASGDFIEPFLVFGLKGLGATQEAAGQAALAVATWRRAIATDEQTRTSQSETLYYLAGCHARLGGIAGTMGSGLSGAQGAAELDRAMALLRRATADGYRKPTWMRRDPDLDPLRARPDFQALMAEMMDLEFPDDSFGRRD